MARRMKKCVEAIGDGITPDKPQIIPTPYACFCNSIAGETYPDKCDAICPLDGLIDRHGCVCVDPGRAGKYCHQDVCKLSGEAYYCTKANITAVEPPSSFKMWELCDTGVNYNQTGEMTACNCTWNVNDAGYNGILCQDPGFRFGRVTMKPTYVDPKYNTLFIVLVVLGMIAVALLILGVACYSFVYKKKRRGGPITYSPPVPGPVLPPQSGEMGQQQVPPQPYYAAASPAPGQPVVGYQQPAPGLATTYTFQPSGGTPVSSSAAYAHPSGSPQPPPPQAAG